MKDDLLNELDFYTELVDKYEVPAELLTTFTDGLIEGYRRGLADAKTKRTISHDEAQDWIKRVIIDKQ